MIGTNVILGKPFNSNNVDAKDLLKLIRAPKIFRNAYLGRIARKSGYTNFDTWSEEKKDNYFQFLTKIIHIINMDNKVLPVGGAASSASPSGTPASDNDVFATRFVMPLIDMTIVESTGDSNDVIMFDENCEDESIDDERADQNFELKIKEEIYPRIQPLRNCRQYTMEE
jgi:hypothetical protein